MQLLETGPLLLVLLQHHVHHLGHPAIPASPQHLCTLAAVPPASRQHLQHRHAQTVGVVLEGVSGELGFGVAEFSLELGRGVLVGACEVLLGFVAGHADCQTEIRQFPGNSILLAAEVEDIGRLDVAMGNILILALA